MGWDAGGSRTLRDGLAVLRAVSGGVRLSKTGLPQPGTLKGSAVCLALPCLLPYIALPCSLVTLAPSRMTGVTPRQGVSL